MHLFETPIRRHRDARTPSIADSTRVATCGSFYKPQKIYEDLHAPLWLFLLQRGELSSRYAVHVARLSNGPTSLACLLVWIPVSLITRPRSSSAPQHGQPSSGQLPDSHVDTLCHGRRERCHVADVGVACCRRRRQHGRDTASFYARQACPALTTALV